MLLKRHTSCRRVKADFYTFVSRMHNGARCLSIYGHQCSQASNPNLRNKSLSARNNVAYVELLRGAGLPTLCFKSVWKLCEVLKVCVTEGHRPAQAQEEPAGWGRFLSEVIKIFCKIKSKFLNSSVFDGGFVMECAKKFWF